MPANVQTNSADLKLDKVKIKFVGPAVRKGLTKGGIQTVADLAGSSVDEIESILENQGLPTPTRTPEKIEEMIQEAQDLVAAQLDSYAQTGSVSAASQLTSVPEFTVFFNYGYIEDGQQRWRALIHPHDDGNKPEPHKWHLNPNDEGTRYDLNINLITTARIAGGPLFTTAKLLKKRILQGGRLTNGGPGLATERH